MLATVLCGVSLTALAQTDGGMGGGSPGPGATQAPNPPGLPEPGTSPSPGHYGDTNHPAGGSRHSGTNGWDENRTNIIRQSAPPADPAEPSDIGWKKI